MFVVAPCQTQFLFSFCRVRLVPRESLDILDILDHRYVTEISALLTHKCFILL